MSDKPMMKCGHAANATDMKTGDPVCAICIGIHPGAKTVADPPHLDHRKAKCLYCNKMVQSNINLPFFEHSPKAKFDSYYCGCRGWE